jgi:hypothetical protein
MLSASSVYDHVENLMSRALANIRQRSKGLISEAGLERLAKRLELEFIWEKSMDNSNNRTLIVAGSALELLIEFSSDIVQSVSLNFPDSAEIVNKHAKAAAEILFNDLRLGEHQSPLTKSLESFTANFERLAALDKLSINPGLNLYEAVAGVYESLNRLYAWELQKAREDPSLAGMDDGDLENFVTCLKSGKPLMNARGRVGMSFEYWKEKRRYPAQSTDPAGGEQMRIWNMMIDCAPLVDVSVGPVRISDKWIGADVEKPALPDELRTGDPIIDWLEPESTFIPAPDQPKVDPMDSGAPLLGPRLPEVVFRATFDPPVPLPITVWDQIQQLGCGLGGAFNGNSFDGLLMPHPPGKFHDATEPRVIRCTKKTAFVPIGDTKVLLKDQTNTLQVDKASWSRTLAEVTFSHPQQLVAMLPYLRQYVFLATVLENSFTDRSDPGAQNGGGGKQPSSSSVQTASTETTQTAYEAFMGGDAATDKEPPLKLDVTLSGLEVPRLSASFPFRDRVANIVVEIREGGRVHVEDQNVLDESNLVAPKGRQRRVEDIAMVLEHFEDLGKMAEFIRTRWA